MAKQKTKTLYVCSNCGEESLTWQGKCPVCGEWNTFKEFHAPVTTAGTRSTLHVELAPLSSQLQAPQERISTGMTEFDRVLGGGLMSGSVILLGGEPGIGKSTLLLQVAQEVADEGPVLYFSGEESSYQVAGRAQRLGIEPKFLFANETRVDAIKQAMHEQKPRLVIVDSIQTLYDDAFPSTPGSLVQVRECALQLQDLAKSEGISLILVGHITKEGTVAGPKTLEHMVDVVLYLEGESRSEIRILRSMKNRFGATYEVGLFELGEKGLANITDPAALFIEEHQQEVPGSALGVVLEGMRPILVEVQALVVPTPFGYPKRTASGIELQRLHILLAILESRTGVSFAALDVFVNVVGGYKIQDRSADLAICMALLSAASGVSLPRKQVFSGEVGLTGEVRRVSQAKRRDEEVQRLGYTVSAPQKTVREVAQSCDVLKATRNRSRRPQRDEWESV
jgi:DNA repair protein RadA/Sms